MLVVSDRSVIDSELQETLENFERRKGVVASITTEKGIKSEQLAAALSGDKKIVVCTIQTFPALIKKMQELTATSGKRFAVIADEAHSSQTGDAALKLRKVLSAAELAELADGGEVTRDTTYVVDFVNEPDDILAAFKTYYATAELAVATDPNLILDLKTKLDA